MNPNQSLATEAFADLDALMGKARTVVDMVGRYSAAVEHAKARKQDEGSTGAGSGSDPDQVDENEFNSLLHNMGIANPVTKYVIRVCYFLYFLYVTVDINSTYSHVFYFKRGLQSPMEYRLIEFIAAC
jgi:hypothetical protein